MGLSNRLLIKPTESEDIVEFPQDFAVKCDVFVTYFSRRSLDSATY